MERKLTILFGSQTNNAKALAELLTRQVYYLFGASAWSASNDLTHKLIVRLDEMDNYAPVSNLAKDKSIFIFVCSTTGNGIPPDNMLQFWKRLMHRSLIPGKSLPKSLKFVVLGLGDSSYPSYNFTAKKLYRRLIDLGASPLDFKLDDVPVGVPLATVTDLDRALGLVDEQAELGFWQTLRWWIPVLWKTISKIFDLPFVCLDNLTHAFEFDFNFLMNPKYLSEKLFFNKYIVYPVCVDDSNSLEHSFRSASLENYEQRSITTTDRNLIKFCILSNDRVTSLDHFQDTRLLKVSFEGVSIK